MTTVLSATGRHARVMLAVLAVSAAVPAVAAAHPYTVDLRQVSGPSPFAGGCPGTAFDATMITGQETEPSITVNPANPRNIVGTWKQDVGPDSTRSDLIGYSLDGGRTWTQAVVDAPPSPWAWQLWHTTLHLPPGPAEITARAWDDTGATQPEYPASLWNPAGYDNNSWPRIRVDVG